jgi:hypothetical protein
VEAFTHAFCDNCGTIQPVVCEHLTSPDTSGKFLGVAVVCKCGNIIATVYKPRSVRLVTQS